MNVLGFRANDRASVERYADSILEGTMLDGMGPRFAAFYLSSGQMKPADEPTAYLTEGVAKLQSVTGASLYSLYLKLFESSPALLAYANGVAMQTHRHILYGKDTEDEDSVGGFSQREIDEFVEFAMAQAELETAQ